MIKHASQRRQIGAFLQDNLSEWLRRQTRNLLGFARAGSNPAVVAFLSLFFRFNITIYSISLSFLILFHNKQSPITIIRHHRLSESTKRESITTFPASSPRTTNTLTSTMTLLSHTTSMTTSSS